jgi:hypothetical protein
MLDWYWSGAPGIYGSARGALVANPETDTAYQDWADGRNPTVWPQDDGGEQTVAALDEVLVNAGLPRTGLGPPPVPASVSRRQFFQAAAQAGIITEAEALAIFTTGALPSSMGAALAALSAEQRFSAQMGILGSASFERGNSLVVALGAAMDKTSAQIDALFILAATL